MLQTLLGVKDVDFVDEKTGKQVKGTKIFTLFPSANVIGDETVSAFLKSNIVPVGIEECIGEAINVEYDRYGKVIQVTL